MASNTIYPLLFENNLHTIVWGGERIAKWKNIDTTKEDNKNQDLDYAHIGESWEVSAVPSSMSVVSNGIHAGRNLPDVIAEHPVEILGESVATQYGNKLPLLVKFIDANKDLSIQVHPDDEMAQQEHGKFGKTEMWYVIDAKPGAYLYAGFKNELTPEEYKRKVEDGTITDALAKHEVKKGDVFYIPAGRVHAICEGVFIAEVQQSSDVTYRIYDYNRPGMDGKPRELHTELAAKALDYKVHDEYRTIYADKNSCANRCIDSPFFNVRVVDIDAPFHRNLIKYDSFIISMCIKGNCTLKMRSSGDEIVLKEGNSCLIPASIADYDVIPEDKVQLLDAFINNKNENIINKITRFLHLTAK
ncbi:MAG: class I mannose-6-phosphate isomerase [Prevotellaceae bacterium]|nr:class I mannose-6-phosphate isomerase [Candidatus Minthosoma caballi]